MWPRICRRRDHTMTKQSIEKDDLYHLCAHIAELLKEYDSIRYLDQEGKAHILLIVDETDINPGGANDRLVQLNPEFVRVIEE